MPSLSFLYLNSVEPNTYNTNKLFSFISKEITATIRETGDKISFTQLTNPRYGQSPQERGFLRGEDVEVKKNAACSLFSERDPLSLKRRSFGSFSADVGRK